MSEILANMRERLVAQLEPDEQLLLDDYANLVRTQAEHAMYLTYLAQLTTNRENAQCRSS